MNKIIIALLVVAAIAAGWFLLTASNTYNYVADVDAEITELENELVTLDAQVSAGTLSEADATAAKVRIVTRLNAINEASTQSEKAELTPSQRTQLAEGLDRLKNILVTYQNTLAIVEANANDTVVAAEVLRRGGSYRPNRTLNETVADVISDVEETVVDSVPEYEADPELDAQVDFAADTTAEANLDVDAETGTDEGEMTDEEATTTDETTESEMDDMDSDMGDSMDTFDAAIDLGANAEVSSEAELEATTTN